MKSKRVETVKPDEVWGRFFMDQSEESRKAFELLYGASFPFVTFSVQGEMGPELKLGRRVYEGLEEIKNLMENEGRKAICQKPRSPKAQRNAK